MMIDKFSYLEMINLNITPISGFLNFLDGDIRMDKEKIYIFRQASGCEIKSASRRWISFCITQFRKNDSNTISINVAKFDRILTLAKNIAFLGKISQSFEIDQTYSITDLDGPCKPILILDLE